MSQAETLLVSEADRIATVTLHRPQARNALDRELVLALSSTLEQMSRSPSVRAIILTGAGEAFCSGADLKAGFQEAASGQNVEARIDEFHAIILAITRSDKPVIAAVDGPAVGFGADLALACDLRLLSSRAYLQEKFVEIGLMPDGGGTYFLPRAIGLARSLEHLFLGTRIEAQQALALGLVNRVVPPERLADEAVKLAERLAAAPPLALAHIKHAARAAYSKNLDEALQAEKAGQAKLLKSKDAQEGVLAWLERRAPHFRGE